MLKKRVASVTLFLYTGCMHEMSIATGIWSTVVATLDSGGHEKLIQVEVTIGEYLGVVNESLELCWEAITMDDTRAMGSVLTITLEPTEVACHQCQHTWLFSDHRYTCPQCGVSDSHIERGKSLYVRQIEVE